MTRERRNFLASCSRARRLIRTLSPDMDSDTAHRVFFQARQAVDRAYDWSRYLGPTAVEQVDVLVHANNEAFAQWETDRKAWREARLTEATRAAREAGLRERDRLIALGQLPPLPPWLR